MHLKHCILSALLLFTSLAILAQPESIDTISGMQIRGGILRLVNFRSDHVAARNIDVWMPAGFDASRPHAIVYMHDGQMLFDESSTWNHQSWNADETADSLVRNQKVLPFVIVGIWNGGTLRHREYFPEKVWQTIPSGQKDILMKNQSTHNPESTAFSPLADAYLRFITAELMPYLQKEYGLTDKPSYNFLAGSSMGGLISWYGLCSYPQFFGGAACLSTHWPGCFPAALFDEQGNALPHNDTTNPIPSALLTWLANHLPAPDTHRIYFDCGDKTLDALYPVFQLQADAILREKGYSPESWITRYFPGTDHSEKAWKSRLAAVLTFLLPTR